MSAGLADRSTLDLQDSREASTSTAGSNMDARLDLRLDGPWPALTELEKSRRAGYLWTARHKSSLSELLACPPSSIFEPIEGYIRAVSGLVAAHRPSQHNRRKKLRSAEAALTAYPEMHPDHELYFFGKWLLLDGCPELPLTRGRRPEPLDIFRTVAAVLALQHAHGGVKNSPDSGSSAHVPQKFTRTDLSKRWRILFGEHRETGHFSNGVRSAERYLDAFIAYLATQNTKRRRYKVRYAVLSVARAALTKIR